MVALFGLTGTACSSERPLSEKERGKLDAALRRVVAGQTVSEEVLPRGERDGEPVYHVLIRTKDAQALRAEAIPIGSVSGSVVTARLTTEEVRRAVQLPAVTSIAAAERNRPH